ncbi:MAG: FtsX-like permease family protein [Candidatus Hodarchaeota archaeon]
MGTVRLMRKAILVATRARKRLAIFVIIYAILAGMVILSIGRLAGYNTTGLVDQKSVVLEATDFDTVTYDEAEQDSTTFEHIEGVEKVVSIYYVNFEGGGNTIRIFGIDPSDRWAFENIKPDVISSGRYIERDGEILISENANLTTLYSQTVDGRTGTIFTEPGLGDSITFVAQGETKTFEVVGTFEEGQVDDDPGNTWMVVTVDDLFEEILQDVLNVHKTQPEINTVLFCYKIVIVAEGSVFWSAVRGGGVWDNVQGIVDYLDAATLQGTYETPDYTKKADNKNEVIADMMLITAALLGGALAASMYAFLITRFRRIEIATLKAIGYTNRNVWIMALGEILLASFAGFILGLLGISVYLGLTGETVVIFSRTTLLTAFLIVVLIQVPAFIWSNKRTLKIPPAEALRTF